MSNNTIKFKAILRLQPERVHDGKYFGTHFHEIEHFFNEDLEEVVMVSFPDSPQFKKVTTFDPPRQWSQTILKDYTITDISS